MQRTGRRRVPGRHRNDGRGRDTQYSCPWRDPGVEVQPKKGHVGGRGAPPRHGVSPNGVDVHRGGTLRGIVTDPTRTGTHRPLHHSIRRTKWPYTGPCTTQSDAPSGPTPALVPLNPTHQVTPYRPLYHSIRSLDHSIRRTK